MRGPRKVDFIACFKAQTDRAEMSLYSGAWIESSAHVVRAQIVDRTRERCERRVPRIQPEIDKPSL